MKKLLGIIGVIVAGPVILILGTYVYKFYGGLSSVMGITDPDSKSLFQLAGMGASVLAIALYGAIVAGEEEEEELV